MIFDAEKFAANLRAERARRDMSQEELADASGVSVASIVMYESGDTGPLLKSAVSLASALGVTVNDLIGWA